MNTSLQMTKHRPLVPGGQILISNERRGSTETENGPCTGSVRPLTNHRAVNRLINRSSVITQGALLQPGPGLAWGCWSPPPPPCHSSGTLRSGKFSPPFPSGPAFSFCFSGCFSGAGWPALRSRSAVSGSRPGRLQTRAAGQGALGRQRPFLVLSACPRVIAEEPAMISSTTENYVCCEKSSKT